MYFLILICIPIIFFKSPLHNNLFLLYYIYYPPLQRRTNVITSHFLNNLILFNIFFCKFGFSRLFLWKKNIVVIFYIFFSNNIDCDLRGLFTLTRPTDHTILFSWSPWVKKKKSSKKKWDLRSEFKVKGQIRSFFKIDRI